jgi:hypothetical protein
MCDVVSPSIFNKVSTTARKVHQCSECERKISASTAYHVISGLWDGEWFNFKLCSFCDTLQNRWHEEDYECQAYGTLYEYLEDEEPVWAVKNGHFWEIVTHDA